MGCPQREGRPDLDLSPDATPNTASWAEHYDNVGTNELNHPVKLRRGKPDPNGWQVEPYEALPSGSKE